MPEPQSALNPQPAPEPQPAPVKNNATVQRGIPRHMLSSVSISAPHEIKPIRSLDSMEVEQLTQEKLETYWRQLLQENANDQKFQELLADKKVELHNNNLFYIKVPNIYFETLLREFQERICSFFRKATNNEVLQYKVAVDVEQREIKAYMPREKFDEMAQRNPSMHTLRKLFPDIDF